MNTQPAPTRRPRGGPRARSAVALVAALLVAALAGCGVRLETAPPSEPVPDALEQVRRSAVADALAVTDVVEQAQQEADLSEQVTAELARILADAQAHAEALGGEYDSGLDLEGPDADEPLPEPDASPEPAGPAEVVGTLADASGRNRTAADTATDHDLARLLASIGASQAVSATRLAALSGTQAPDPLAPTIPEPGAQPTEEPEPDSTATDIATTAPGEDPVPPSGLSASDFQAIVEAEDGARYALELRAARTSEQERARLIERSRVHGSRAQAWAELASIAGTEQDPRRVAYAVPRADDDATLVQALQTGLATDYASLVGTTAPKTRGLLVDLVIDAALTLEAWGAPPVPFPGMPELAP